jgi:drug/metabolite transporter superfamily protein YnfA
LSNLFRVDKFRFYIKLKETAKEPRVFRKNDFILLLVIFSAMGVGIGLPEFGRVFAPYPLYFMMFLLFFQFFKDQFSSSLS